MRGSKYIGTDVTSVLVFFNWWKDKFTKYQALRDLPRHEYVILSSTTPSSTLSTRRNFIDSS